MRQKFWPARVDRSRHVSMVSDGIWLAASGLSDLAIRGYDSGPLSTGLYTTEVSPRPSKSYTLLFCFEMSLVTLEAVIDHVACRVVLANADFDGEHHQCKPADAEVLPRSHRALWRMKVSWKLIRSDVTTRCTLCVVHHLERKKPGSRRHRACCKSLALMALVAFAINVVIGEDRHQVGGC